MMIANDFICGGIKTGNPIQQTPSHNFWHLLAHIHILRVSESVYDLLPKELQLPLASSQDSLTMSQKSGGEAGPLPPAAVASGSLHSLQLFLLPSYLFCCPKKVSHPDFSLLINLDLFHCWILHTFVRLNMHASDLISTSSVLLWSRFVLPVDPSNCIPFALVNNSKLYIFFLHLHTFLFLFQGLFLFTGTCVLVL